MSPHDALFIKDPTDHAFDLCLTAHSQVEVYAAGRSNAKRGRVPTRTSITTDFYNLTAASLIKQLSDASNDVGSYWLTAWINAGRPQLPH